MFQPLNVIIREIHIEKPEEMSHTNKKEHYAQAPNFRSCC